MGAGAIRPIVPPTSEHLIPLLVAAGAAGTDTAVRTYANKTFGKANSGFRFG